MTSISTSSSISQFFARIGGPLLLTAYWVMFVMFSVSALVLPYVIGQFSSSYTSFGFGTDLPALTKSILEYRNTAYGLPLLPLIPAVLLSVSKKLRQTSWRVFTVLLLAFFIGWLVLLLMLAIGLYLPMEKIGTVV